MISDQVVLLSNGYVIAEGKIRGVRGEIEEQPMQIMVRCSSPAELAARVFAEDSVTEARVHKDGKGLLIKTRDPDKFYLLLNRLALNGIGVESVTPADDDVNSLYEYLIGNEEPPR
jgi:ABC-2 type transport system ATP-binding protein